MPSGCCVMQSSLQPGASMQPLTQAKSAKHSAFPWQSHHVSAHCVATHPEHGSWNDGQICGALPVLELDTTVIKLVPPPAVALAEGSPEPTAASVEDAASPPEPALPWVPCTNT